MGKTPRFVNDTNVWLSTLYFSGKPAKIVSLIEDKKLISVTSNFILNELHEKMVIDFQTPSFAANGTISYIRSMSELVPLRGKEYGLRDAADNQVLETAVVGKCQWLVTGDKDLLTLKGYNDVQIVNPEDFLIQYKQAQKN